MRHQLRTLLALATILAAPSVLTAQTTTPAVDLSADLAANQGFALVAHQTAGIVISVSNHGTTSSQRGAVLITFPPHVQVVSAGCLPVGGSETDFRCNFPGVSPGRDFPIALRALIDRGPGDVAFVLNLSAGSNEVAPANAQRSVTLSIFDDPNLHPTVDAPDRLDGNDRATIRYTAENRSDHASGATFSVTALNDVPLLSADTPGWSCVPLATPFSTSGLTCSTDAISAHGSKSISITYQFPFHDGHFTAYVVVTPNPPPSAGVSFASVGIQSDITFSRWFQVTNTNDQGPGSLRQAIDDAKAPCSEEMAIVGHLNTPCGIELVIETPPPASSWFTIQPLSPLPVIAGIELRIDGGKQGKVSGQPGRSGPMVFLDGARAGGNAEGLSFSTRFADVRGLAIGGFSRNALLLNVLGCTVIGNYFGLDPDGNPAPNGLRGIMALSSGGAASLFGGQIANNVASSNVRSGIYVLDADGISVHDNRIGLAPNSDAARPNGASGIFIGFSGTRLPIPADLHGDIFDNTIGPNADFGIALQTSLGYSVRQNTIVDSGQQAIDIGLDGPNVKFAPAITAVRRDMTTGETIIEGVIHPPDPSFGFYETLDVYLYLNDSPRSQAQRLLGVAHALDASHFTLHVPDLLPAGGYIAGSGVTTVNLLDEGRQTTSTELGVPFPILTAPSASDLSQR